MHVRTWLPLVALLLVGCNAMQESPVAPSAVLPAGDGGRGLPTYTSFDVTLSNGTTTAYAEGPWLGFLSVQPRGGARITTPARVTLDCGNGVVTDFGAGVGYGLQFTCRWATPGDYVVRATVEAQNGVTTVATLPVHVEPPFTVPDVVTVDIAAALASGEHEWIFTPTVTGRVVSLTWNFGDGTTITTGPGQVMHHSFSGKGVFVVTATPRLEDGSTRAPGRIEIVN